MIRTPRSSPNPPLRSSAGQHRGDPAHADTATRSRPHHVLPDRHAWLDLGAVVLLGGIALSSFATSFTGWQFLVVGVLGLLLGTGVTHVCRALGWPLVAPMTMLVLLYFLLGGPLCLRAMGDTAFLPGSTTLGTLADQAVFGWKDLLTTLPPVDGDGRLLALPWLIGLVTGLVGTSLAHAHTRRPWLTALLPVLGLTAVLVGAILLGVRHPHSVVLQGAVFAGVALGWLAVRVRRLSATVHGGTAGLGRVAAGAALVALASALAIPASALVAGSDDDRTVVREWVHPPFDIGRYPSPLAGFRKYVDLQGGKDPANVYEETLFTVDGAPEGTRVRIAAMDRYDGMVWGASDDALPGAADDSFQRVSSTIDNPLEGEEVRASVTIGEAYEGVWLPTIGGLTSMEFRAGDVDVKAETFRYNLATSTAVAPTGVHPGDSYEFTAVVPDDQLDRSTVGSTAVTPMPEGLGFLDGPATEWTEKAATPMERVLAVAKRLKTDGKYSDGVIKTERWYFPGHSIQRLSDGFLAAPQMVGNDEQYAAVMALLAHEIGVPARVVLGAVLPADGVVEGKDVQAWVELRAADGSWRTLPTEAFMSQEPPAEQLPQTNQPMTGTVVPPPNPIPPPSDAGDQSDADLKERKTQKKEKHDEEEGIASLVDKLPRWVILVTTYVGGPLLLLALLVAAIIGAKALRRRRRRNASTVSTRFVGAWRELVDHARDLGQPIPLGPTVTRREQSGAIALDEAPVLARHADSFVFGPHVPEPAAAASYWERVDDARRAMSSAVGRRRRLLAAVSLTTFRRTSRAAGRRLQARPPRALRLPPR